MYISLFHLIDEEQVPRQLTDKEEGLEYGWFTRDEVYSKLSAIDESWTYSLDQLHKAHAYTDK